MEEQQNPGMMMPPMHSMGGNMVMMTNPEEVLEKIERQFRGQIETAPGEWKQEYEPLINELGINKVMGMVRPVVNRVTFMSNYEEEHIISTMNYLANTLIELLLQEKEVFDIKSDSDRTSIVFSCLSLSFSALRRPFKEGDKRFFKGSTMELNYGYSTQGQQPQGNTGGGSFGGMLNPKNWGRGGQ